ncbi:mechanosensitive ion channel [Mesobacillus foraminis]|uniref:Putative transporter (Transmembrane protein) n=1 Tax=Mesobacillus foraminis TaxID=279826 RepID=A0A4R2BCC9_9BACI|nr:mechanosensitive ion channel [Mesobacillus foraminis]TCN24143.1 putative transporter (transmembrane protein) [Mesobacillus foraminis]
MENVFNQWWAYLGRLPELLIALLVLLVGWLIAKGISKGVQKALNKSNLDERLLGKMGVDTKKYSSEETVGKIVFWLLMLVVVVIFLNMLNIGGAASPLNTLLSGVFGFIPNLLGAAIILAVGWIVARLVKGLVTGLLRKLGADRLAERMGISKVLEGTTLSNVIGTIVFVLIMIPVVIAVLERLQLQGIAAPAISMLNTVLNMIPNIIVAVLLIAAGVWLGKWVKKIVASLLHNVGLDSFLSKIGLGAATQTGNSMTPASIIGYLAQIVVVLLFTIEALQLVGLDNIVGIINAILGYLPRVIGALLVLGIGLYAANLVQKLVTSMIVQRTEANLFGNLAKYIIIIFAVFMAIDQLQIANTVVNTAFMLILGGLALAFGLAFGLGGKEFAAKHLARFDQTLERTQTVKPNMEAVKNEAKINNGQPGTGPVTGSPVNPARNYQGGMDPAFPNTEVNIIKPGDTKNPGNGLDSPGRGKQVPRKGKGRD